MDESQFYEEFISGRKQKAYYYKEKKTKNKKDIILKKEEVVSSTTNDKNDDNIKLIEFWLMKFDININSNNNKKNNKDQTFDESNAQTSRSDLSINNKNTGSSPEEQNKLFINELYESLNGLFSIDECKKAFLLAGEDIQQASSWLIDEGEKDRTKRNLRLIDKTLLCQSQIISEISQKA